MTRPPSAQAQDRRIAVGKFGAPHGVRGELRIKSYTGDPAAIGRYGELTDLTGARTFKITALRMLKDDMLVARLAGLDNRRDAASLAGIELFVARRQLPAPSEDEFYHDDLIGLIASTPDGARLGRVVALHNFGAGDILEIAADAGGETLMLPFTKTVAPEIDFAERRIVIIAPREVEGEAGGHESPAAQQSLSEKE
jgi:16S rRNA processing protein RimM